MPGPGSLEDIVEQVLVRLRALVGLGPCPLCGAPPQAAPPPPRRARAPGEQVAEHPGRLLSEEELVRYYREGVRALRLSAGCLVTPAARDRARDLAVDLIEGGRP